MEYPDCVVNESTDAHVRKMANKELVLKAAQIHIDRANKRKELLAELKELAIREHDNDCASIEYSILLRDECDCGADEHNAKVKKIYKKLVGE